MDLAPVLFGHEGYRIRPTQTTTYTATCPKCGDLGHGELTDYNDAVARLRGHAEMHDVVLPLKAHDWKGNEVG